ncbi:MAG: ABC transporter permease [Gammaproteobacteria bacterium]|nr:ABC transporter permease [Gammaproteobacteria bacterium]
MNAAITIARKEFADGLRNRWMLAMTLVFALFAVGIAWLGGSAAGQIGFASIPSTIASLASLATFLVPLIALLLAYDAIIGEDEGGTLLLLLTYPLGRGQLLACKFLGQGAILACATLLGFGAAALAIGVLVEDIDQALLVSAFGRFVVSSTLLGWSFLALAYVVSVRVSEKSRAAGLALGIWFLFVLVFDLALLGVLVGSEGRLSPDLLPWLLLGNPTDIYRLINLGGFEQTADASGVLALGDALPFGSPLLWLSLLAWTLLPLLLAYILFRHRRI